MFSYKSRALKKLSQAADNVCESAFINLVAVASKSAKNAIKSIVPTKSGICIHKVNP